MTHKRRTMQEIVSEILRVAKDGAKKTHILHTANLSFYQLQQYLNALEKGGFITEQFDTWKTTEKGLHVIEACDLCLSLTEKIPI